MSSQQRPGGGPTPGRPDDPATARERDLLLREFAGWLQQEQGRAAAAWAGPTMSLLLQVKAAESDCPAPTVWTRPQAAGLLTEIVPAHVVQTREQAMRMVPALRWFVSFLRARGHWHPDSMSPGEAPTVIAELEFPVLEAADDPSRRPYHANLLAYALERGVDVDDQDALSHFLGWVGALPDAAQRQLGTIGRPADGTHPYDPAAPPVSGISGTPPAGAGDYIEIPAELSARSSSHRRSAATGARGEVRSWPPFVPELDDTTLEQMAHRRPEAVTDRPLYQDSPLVRSALTLLDVVGPGRSVTATGALNREDTAMALAHLGRHQQVRSLWDVPQLSGAWITLLDGGWLTITGRRVHPAPGVAPPAAGEDPAGYVAFGHALLTSTLLAMYLRGPDDGGFRGMPGTLAALAAACRPEGLTLAGTTDARGRVPPWLRDPRTGDADVTLLRQYRDVAGDLRRLADIGMISADEHAAHGDPAVYAALVSMMEILEEDEH